MPAEPGAAGQGLQGGAATSRRVRRIVRPILGSGSAGTGDWKGRERSVPDIVDLVRADHGRISGLFAELEDARGENAPARLGAVWAELAGLLDMHVAATREICYLTLLGSATKDEITTDLDDIAETVAEARLQPPGSPLWWLAVRGARAAVTGHIDVIESGVLETLRCQVPQEEREDLARRWQAFVAARAQDTAAAHDPADTADQLVPRHNSVPPG